MPLLHVCVWPIIAVGCIISSQRGLHCLPDSLVVIGQVSGYTCLHLAEGMGEERIETDKINTKDETGWINDTGSESKTDRWRDGKWR